MEEEDDKSFECFDREVCRLMIGFVCITNSFSSFVLGVGDGLEAS